MTSDRIGPMVATVGDATGDGSWVWQEPQPQGNPLRGVSCPSSTNCVVVGDDATILYTTNSGSTWTAALPPSTSANLRAVSCPSSSICYAVGDSGKIVTSSTPFATTAWTAISPASPTTATLRSISCAASGTCLVAGDGGALWSLASGTWTQQTGTTNNLYGVSCPSSTTCIAVGAIGTALAQPASGSAWTTQTTGKSADLEAVSCPASGVCTAVGQYGTALGLSSGAWTAQATNTSSTLWGVNCPASGTCFVAADSGNALKYSSSAWASATITGGAFGLYSMGCTAGTPSTCIAVGNGGEIVNTTNAGTTPPTWTLQSASLTNGSLNGISCSTISACTAVGDGGVSFSTTTNPAAWTSASTGESGQLTAVSCWSSGNCGAVGAAGIDASSSSNTWTAHTALSASYLNGVSCTSATFCLAVGDGGMAYTSTNGAVSWSAVSGTPLTVSGYHPNLDAVSCLSSTSCVAVGDSGVIEYWNGSTWTQEAAGKTGSYLGAVSCTTVSGTATCWAAGGAGTVLWSNNTSPSQFSTWNSPAWSSGAPASSDLLGMACAATGTCTADGESGTLFTFTTNFSTNTGTASVANAGTKQPLAAIGCNGPCWAVGYPGVILSNGIADTFSPNPINFGTVDLHTAPSITETITNSAATLVIGTISISAGDYSLSSDLCSGHTLVMGATCTYVVTFVPSTTGTRTATITIPSNAQASPQTLPVTGAAVRTEYAFVLGGGNTAYFSTWLQDVQQATWTSITGMTLQGAPEGCWDSHWGEMVAYGVGTDNNIWWSYIRGTTTSGWLQLPAGGQSSGPAGKTTVGVACLNDGTGDEEIFVHSTSGNYLYMAVFNPGTWTFKTTPSWTQNPCNGCWTGSASATVQGTSVDVYAVNSGGSVYEGIYTARSFNTYNWVYLGYSSTALNVGANYRASGYDDVWITGASGAPTHAIFQGTTYVASEPLGGALTSWPAGTWNVNEIHAYGVGTGASNNIWRDSYNGGWSGWTQAPGNGTATASIGVAAD